jgi:hypothetical protein
MSGRTGQSPIGALCGIYLNLRLARTKSEGLDNVRWARIISGKTGQSPVRALGLGVLDRVENCSNLYFHFILHTPS